MHVDPQPAPGRELAQDADRFGPLLPRWLVVRDAAHDLDAAIERRHQQVAVGGRAQDAVLREGHELEIDIGRHLAPDLEQRVDRQQARIADIDMAADCQHAAADRPVAPGERAALEDVGRQPGLALAPYLDRLEQRAGLVIAGLAETERRIEVEMRIDEGRRDEIVAGIELERAGGGQVGRDGGDFAVLHADIEAGAAVRQACVADNQVERAHGPILARTE